MNSIQIQNIKAPTFSLSKRQRRNLARKANHIDIQKNLKEKQKIKQFERTFPNLSIASFTTNFAIFLYEIFYFFFCNLIFYITQNSLIKWTPIVYVDSYLLSMPTIIRIIVVYFIFNFFRGANRLSQKIFLYFFS